MLDATPLVAGPSFVEVLNYALTEPLSAAALVILYVQYSVRYGAISQHFRTLETTIAILIALSEQVDGVDERAVASALDRGGDSSAYRARRDIIRDERRRREREARGSDGRDGWERGGDWDDP